MTTDTRAELATAFDCTFREGGLDEFEPEPDTDTDGARGGLWLRVASTSADDLQRREPFVPVSTRQAWPYVALVVTAAAIAGAVVTWLGLQPREQAAVSAPRVDVTNASTTPPVATPPTVAAPIVPESLVTVATATRPERPPATPDPLAARLDPQVEQTLAALSQAYRSLDAAALTAVWPGADRDALGAAFSELKYQALSFDRCAARSSGSDAVMVSCDVAISGAPKTGDPVLHRRHESWTMALNRTGARWTIAGVSTRPAGE